MGLEKKENLILTGLAHRRVLEIPSIRSGHGHGHSENLLRSLSQTNTRGTIFIRSLLAAIRAELEELRREHPCAAMGVTIHHYEIGQKYSSGVSIPVE